MGYIQQHGYSELTIINTHYTWFGGRLNGFFNEIPGICDQPLNVTTPATAGRTRRPAVRAYTRRPVPACDGAARRAVGSDSQPLRPRGGSGVGQAAAQTARGQWGRTVSRSDRAGAVG